MLSLGNIGISLGLAIKCGEEEDENISNEI